MEAPTAANYVGRHPRRLGVDLAAEFRRLRIFVAGDKIMNSNKKFRY